MKNTFLLFIVIFTLCLPLQAEDVHFVWHNPIVEAPAAIGGSGIDFFTNSAEIAVRYMPINPADKGCIDLYGTDKDGEVYDFAYSVTKDDLIVCRFDSMTYANSRLERGYNFHLSVGEGVKNVEIGTLADAAFGFDPITERPVVVLQSPSSPSFMDKPSCKAEHSSSLPYLLRRQTGHDVVVLPMNAKGRLSAADDARLVALRPLLIVGNNKRARRYAKTLHTLAYSPRGDVQTQVEDIRALLGEDSERRCVFRPIPQQRDPYDWQMRHRNVLKVNAEEPPSVVLIGNSITHYWAGLPTGRLIRGADSWENLWQGTTAHNLGFGWDRIENVLWRINHGELDGYTAEKVLLLLGTNNIAYNTDDEIAEGIVEVVRNVHAHQPEAQIYVCSVLPRLDYGERVASLNATIQGALLQHHSPALYLDLAPMAFDADGNFRRDLFSDGLHPNAEGYRVLAARMKELLHL